jgi:hypothetical protein
MADLFMLMMQHPIWAAGFMLWGGICLACGVSPLSR